MCFYYYSNRIGSTHRSIARFSDYSRASSLAFFRNESGLIKRTLPVLAARKMAGGHSSRSWTARRNLILEKGVIYRRTVSNHRGGRKKSYLMEKILCPAVLRANNWRTPRKVAYIALLPRGANCNTIRSGAFCRWKNLARTNRFFELPAFSKKWMYADRVCIDETLRCWWKLWRISFFLSFFWVIYGPLDVDMICTTVVNTVSLCFVPLKFIFDLTYRFILLFKSVHQLLLQKSWKRLEIL